MRENINIIITIIILDQSVCSQRYHHTGHI